MRHRPRGAVEADALGSGRLLPHDLGKREGGVVNAEAVAADILERARRPGKRLVGVPDHQGRLHRFVLRKHERLGEDAADEGLEPAEPELRLRGEHHAGVDACLREESANAPPALGELPGWRAVVHGR